MEDLSKEIIDVLTGIIPMIMENGYPIIYQQKQVMVPHDNNSFTGDIITIPDYKRTFYQNAQSILDSYDITSLEKKIDTTYPYLHGNYGTRFGGRGFSPRRIIEILLKNILTIDFKLETMEGEIKKHVDNFIKMVKKKKTDLNLYLPISNLNTKDNIDHIEFTSEISVKKLSDEEINSLFRNSYDLPDVNRICRYSIVVNYEENISFNGMNTKPNTEELDKLENDISNIVYSLNIIQNGSLGVDSRYYQYLDYFQHFNGNHYNKSHREIKGTADPLNSEQITLWKNIFNQLSNSNIVHFNLAFKKLNEAETRYDPEDSIVDSVIGLESLLLNEIGNESTRGEMKYRFCLNYSSLFSKEKRNEAYKDASAIYDFRSKIVHGAKINKSKIKFNSEFIDIRDVKTFATKMLRHCIASLLSLSEKENVFTKGFWLNRVLNLS
jgi:hypothetical protein